MDPLHPQVHARWGRPVDLPESVHLLTGDVTHAPDWNAVSRLFRPSQVVHLAAETGTAQSLSEATRHASVNVVGTAQLLDALTRADIVPGNSCSPHRARSTAKARGEPARPVLPRPRTHAQLARRRLGSDGPGGARWGADRKLLADHGAPPDQHLRRHQARPGAHAVSRGRPPMAALSPSFAFRTSTGRGNPRPTPTPESCPCSRVRPAEAHRGLRGRRDHPRLRLHRRRRRGDRRRLDRPAAAPRVVDIGSGTAVTIFTISPAASPLPAMPRNRSSCTDSATGTFALPVVTSTRRSSQLSLDAALVRLNGSAVALLEWMDQQH